VWSGGTYCQKGDRGDRVWILQRHMTLFYPGYNNYVPNGYYGVGTTAGVKEFQARVGITGPDADGEIVGPATMRALIQRGFRP
jgi:peptidoglycan hydrolase-like protein with peptidoglycan-binding domain